MAYKLSTFYEAKKRLSGVTNLTDLEPLLKRMKFQGFLSEYVNDKVELMQFLV